MNPAVIQPHPDYPEAYILMKAPPEMENCVDLAYRVVQHPSLPGKLALVAEFDPTNEEREALANTNLPLRFMMTLLIDDETGGPIVPPIALWVRGHDEV